MSTSTPTHVVGHPDRPGALDLKIIGHELIDMLIHAGGGHHVPAWLRVDERGAQRSLVNCPVCGAWANSGSFKLAHAYRPGELELPYLAVHVLAVHGTMALQVQGARIEPKELATLRAFLNQQEQELAKLLLGHVAMAAPIPHVGVLEEPVKGVVACATCGDRINMGKVTFSNEGGSVELPYLALHALAEHRDARYGEDGLVDLRAVQRVLASADLAALGKRLTGMLEFLGGHDEPPAGLLVEEHPLRGIEQCTQCDEHPNMGSFSLLRRAIGASMTLPYIAVHALVAHQSAHYQGSLHDGWVDVPKLRRLLGDASG